MKPYQTRIVDDKHWKTNYAFHHIDSRAGLQYSTIYESGLISMIRVVKVEY